MNKNLNIRSERARPAGPSRSLKWHSASSCCSDHSQRRFPPECQCARSARGARPSVAIRLCKECKVVRIFLKNVGREISWLKLSCFLLSFLSLGRDLNQPVCIFFRGRYESFFFYFVRKIFKSSPIFPYFFAREGFKSYPISNREGEMLNYPVFFLSFFYSNVDVH